MPLDERFDIENWLQQLGLSQYTKVFRENDVDAAVLGALTSEDLRELGVASVGHRRRILEATRLMRAESPAQPGAAEPRQIAPHARETSVSAERRYLTVMFCDLMDSTALSVRVDPEDFREFIADYRTAVEQAIRPHRGHIARFQGDGVMIFFGYPRSFAHDAESAVAAGLAIVDRIAELPAFAGAPARVRIGIATGLAVVGDSDLMRLSMGDDIVGETLNLAARLQALATPNGIVIAVSTHERIGTLFECTELGPFDLKGFDHPVSAWQVHGQSASASRFDALRTTRRDAHFFDREVEYERLRNRLAAARAGRGQIVVISGEAGFGKSRLAREVLSELGQKSIECPILQCTPYNVGSPLHPVRYYLLRRSGIVSGDAPESSLRKLSALLAELEPVTSERLALLAELVQIPGADKTALQGLSSHELRLRTMRALSTIMAALARAASAIIIEDIQWIDPSTAELIESMLPAVRTLPVLLIGTIRPGGPLPSWIERPEARLIQLERLPNADVRRLIRAIAGEAMLDAVVDTIAARSDGVPIFAEELTRGYLDAASRGQSAESELSKIPSTLVESLLARLDGLERGRKFASIAAVIGREFPIAILTAVSDLPEDEVRAGIGELLDAEVLVPGHSAFGEAIAFRHWLVRDAAYQLLLRRDRLELHARVAETLVTAFPSIAEALPHIVAIQLAESGDFERAAVYWDRAGANAAKRSAYSDAVEHFAKAIAVNARCAEGRERDERALAYHLNRLSALIAARGFAADGVAEEMEQAEHLSLRLETRANLIPALISKWAVLGSGGSFRASFELAHKIGEAAQDGSEIDRLLAHRVLGTSSLFSGNLSRAMQEFQSFLTLFDPVKHGEELEKVGPSDHAARVMLGVAQIHTLRAEFEASDDWRMKAIDTARKSGRVHDICHAIVFAGCFHASLRRETVELARYAAELKELSTLHDLPYWRGHADLFAGLGLIGAGRNEAGFAAARSGIKGLIASNAFAYGWYILYAEACVAAGRLTEASDTLALALPPLEQGEAWLAADFHRISARLALARGESLESVSKMLETALDIAEAQGTRLFADRVRDEMRALAATPGTDQP